MNFVARQCIVRVRGTGCGAARWTRHRRRRSRTAGRRRRRRAPADHTQARHGKAVFRPDRPRVFKTATYVRTPQPPPQTNPELRNLHPNRTTFQREKKNHPSNQPGEVSRPVEDCEECPALAGVRNLGLDDPSADRPIKHCNFGDRSIQVLPRLQHVEGRDGYLRSVHRAAPASGSCSPARWADR
jgi:hypothetical protein